jgi:hypothetical protein
MRWKITSQRPVAATVIAILGLAVTGSQASEPSEDDLSSSPASNHVRGDFGFTTKESCVRTPFQVPSAPGIDPATGQLLVAADVSDAVGTGVMHFSLDGKVSVSVVGAELQTSQVAVGDIPVTPGVTYACDGTYVLQSGGQIAVSIPSCNVSSNKPGVTVTVGPINLEGFVARDRETMNLNEVKGSIEVVAVSAGGTVVQQRQRICVASYGLSRVHNSQSK